MIGRRRMKMEVGNSGKGSGKQGRTESDSRQSEAKQLAARQAEVSPVDDGR